MGRGWGNPFQEGSLSDQADLFAVIHTTVTLQRLGVTFVKREDGRMIIRGDNMWRSSSCIGI